MHLHVLYNCDNICVLARCPVGQYSDTGLEPCWNCPWNHYSSSEMSTKCIPCPLGQVTDGVGKSSFSDCQGNHLVKAIS